MRHFLSVSFLLSLYYFFPSIALASYDLNFSTYLGGSLEDYARDVVVDSQGNIYVTGSTKSTNFLTTTGAYDRSFGGGGSQVGSQGAADCFITKFSAQGTVIWSTYLGGPNYDRCYAIELDPSGNVVVAGRAGPGFPVTPGVIQPTFKGGDQGAYGYQNAFVSKISSDGTRLLFSTYLGNTFRSRDVAIDSSGNIYLPIGYDSNHGSFYSTLWYTNAFQKTPQGLEDTGIIKINATATQVLWATLIAGSGVDYGDSSIRVDSQNNVYLGMDTESNDIPTTANAFDRTYNGNRDYYVAKVSPDGSQLLYGSYLGGSGMDFNSTHNIALDVSGNLFAAIYTNSANFPVTSGTVDGTFNGGSDTAIVKISPQGQLLASTFVGGTAEENADGIYTDSQGNVYISGMTASGNFPVTLNAFQPVKKASNDGFFISLSPNLQSLLYASFFGGGLYDNIRASYLNSNGSLYLVGGTTSQSGFPLKNAFQNSYGGGTGAYGSGDAFLSVFNPQTSSPSPTPPPPTITSSPLIGDLDLDGDVDIFDYNLLVQHFNTTNCTYNLTGSCLIDIFDYNLLIQNF